MVRQKVRKPVELLQRCSGCGKIYKASELLRSPVTATVCDECFDKRKVWDIPGSCLGCIWSVLSGFIIFLVLTVVFITLFL